MVENSMSMSNKQIAADMKGSVNQRDMTLALYTGEKDV
jgi:hypothetical protein